MAQGMELLDNGTKVFTGPGAACWPGLPCRAAKKQRWTCAAGAGSYRWPGTMPGTAAHAQRWSWMPMLRPCAAVLCRKRRVQSILPLFAPTCGRSAKAARNRGNMTSPPATRPILPADMSARMPAAPRPGMTAAARCRMLPPVRPVPCTMAASWPYATARNRWRRCLPRSAPLGWSPSGWLWCARMNTANPGCFWWKPRKEESRGSGGRRTF